MKLQTPTGDYLSLLYLSSIDLDGTPKISGNKDFLLKRCCELLLGALPSLASLGVLKLGLNCPSQFSVMNEL